MNKKSLSEEDIKMKYITPAIEKSGWDIKTQVRAEYSFTDGRIIVRGNLVARGKRKRADYILSYKPNMPLAIIEAKDNKKSMGAGMQQGLEYGDILDIPFIYSSNGDGFLEHDNFTGKERELSLDEFPSPNELWERYKMGKGIQAHEEKIVAEDYFFDMSGKTPRYYQRVAINRTIEAIAKGQDRILLVMATGTGKTYTAFQIIYRLWKSKTKKRILFLADRNILVDQTMANDFKHFGDKMIKVNRKNIDKAHEIYLALYQSMTGSEDWQNVYKEFSPDFFDLIIVDECHRGSAKDNSAWREVLEYFNSATQIGLTATPKETKDISTSNYFGEPVYTYSLKQGIEDGFLAPYKVVRVSLDKDLEGYRPAKGKLDKYGNLIEDRIYNISDFDKNLILEKRTEIVAKKITEFLKKTNRFDKTIVFCVDIDHAERMRQSLINENSDLTKENNKYIMRITGDNDEGKAQLDNFIDPASKYPTIVTTSKLMTTGVDAQTCKLIVLDSNINSITEFKQIIGRGTRIKEEYGKQFFTIMDFRGVTRLFADPEFDGDPVVIYEPEDDDSIVPPDEGEEESGDFGSGFSGDSGDFDFKDEEEGKRVKYVIDDVDVMIVNERVEYYDKDGKLVTESLKDYTRKNIRNEYADLNEFINRWNNEDKKTAILEELKERGIFLDAIKKEVGKELDDFDLVLHLAFDQKPLTRKERADNVKKRNYFGKYSNVAREVLEALLDKYMNEGISELESMEILKLDPFTKIGTPTKIITAFGGRDTYIQTVRVLEKQIYA
ncbi:EcoAI/FtnUII family type I restriction enzme subunit R [Clostridium sporogenes]|uniref:EcoAI/FtnUII family type I restriction enzme subunit R n=1 Tax=Clostridium sporogenes TaxID=1509 RepID=UPI003CC7E082